MTTRLAYFGGSSMHPASNAQSPTPPSFMSTRDIRKQRRAQIPLAGIGQHAQNRRSLRRLLRTPAARRQRSPPEEIPTKIPSFWPGPCCTERIRIRDSKHLADRLRVHRVARQLRNKVRAPSLHRMRLPRGMAAAFADPSACAPASTPLDSIGASSGSQTTIFVSGRSFASTRATPFSVPPVPNPVTQ